MKHYLFALGFALLAGISVAQTKNHKLGLTVGGGSQKYKGDLGNGFTVKNDTWYGGMSYNAGYYFTRSFDAGVFGFVGDYGFCQPKSKPPVEVAEKDRCAGCVGRVGLGNLSSRLASVGVFAKYKFANGYILKEDAKVQPYVYLGAAANRITDIMKMKCVNPGNYNSINAGLGAKYYLTDKINVGYNLGFGLFSDDHLDFIMKGVSDMYMQNTLTVGIDLL